MATVSILNLLTGSSSPLLASGDVLPFVDVSDATQSPSGSTVKATMTQFFAAIPAPIIITSTTATQFQVKYDGSNHVTVAVSSAGLVTLNATGASAGFSFSDAVTLAGVAGSAVTLTAAASGTYGDSSLVRWRRADGTTSKAYAGFSGADSQQLDIATTDATGTIKLYTANQVLAVTISAAQAVTFAAGITATTGTFSGAVKTSSASGGIGYGTGAGGTVTQASNKGTAVTLNTVSGQIITSNGNLVAAATVTFTVNNSTVVATDVIALSSALGPTSGYGFAVNNVTAGVFTISITNNTGVDRAEAVPINFVVIKGVTS